MTYRQPPPNTLKIEMTEGCNLRCGMCGIQGIREKAGGPFVYMEVDTAEKLVALLSSAGWKSKVEFAMRGEPLMNPNAAAIIATFRKGLPRNQLMLTTNGIPLLRGGDPVRSALTLFDAGLNVLAVDCYEASKKVEQRLRAGGATLAAAGVAVSDYKTGATDSPYARHSAKERRLFLIEDFEKAALAGFKVGTKSASNHTGVGFPPTFEPLQKRCARPFREFTVRYDGKVNLCCNDWRGIYKVGSVLKAKHIDELWQGEPLRAARTLLYHRDRTFAPCNTCDNVSFRVGLLPDPAGRDDLPTPTKADHEIAKKCGAGAPMTQPVARPWETLRGKLIPIVDQRKAEEWEP